MKVLVATEQTQGWRDNDYHFTIEGELVLVGRVCARDEEDPDGGCGCGRGFAGTNSHRATTTARVADLSMTRDDYVEGLSSSLQAQGYRSEAAEDIAANLIECAGALPTGTIVERRLDVLRVRSALGFDDVVRVDVLG